MPKKDPGARESVDVLKVDQVLQTETGGRALTGPSAVLLFIVPVCWSLFQLWIASPLPFILDFGIFNSTEARSIHLAFAVFLAYSAFPMIKGRHTTKVPVYDWVLALAAAFAASYLYVFYDQLSTRPGAPITMDLWVALTGLVLLLEATRRALGLPLTIVAAVFITYSLAGPYMPDVISHKGVSLNKLASHQWLGTEGVFGVALGVSTSFVFLFVLFGALLERAGAGNYFIKMAYAMLGHMRGGPAKAAVVSSGLSGVISGSSIANVVTTGTFTIPLMKRVGFPATKAGAVEVAASTNGQLTPPIMGAAAFLMVEYVGISYLEVIKHAILPAMISYVALIYIVHLEACKLNMQGIERPNRPTLAQRMLTWVVLLLGLSALTLAVYYGIGWMKTLLGDAAIWVLGPLLLAIYIALVGYATRFPDLEEDDPSKEMGALPEVGPTVKSGLYYLLPVVVLVWCLTVERFSPQLSAFWATLFMIFIVITQRPLRAFFRKHGSLPAEFVGGIGDLFHSLATGARNMVGIGVATATAGIVVGTVTLTGIGLVMTEFVELISGGNILLMLIFTALISLILGMGLPTTANYIVVSTLMAPVIVTLGAENGLLVPLIAVHLFVFYFGILADDTPPVGLAAYAAAAGIDVSGISLLEHTTIVGVMLGAMLPFLFSAFTMNAVGRAAFSIVNEVRRQFREIPGLMEGTAMPDYARCVDISTKGALKEMIVPGLLAVIAPVATGFVLGTEALGGLLIGSVASGFMLAIMMSSAGGAWDNAKKYVELGHFGGKGSEAHKAAVEGDVVGDPFKDTSGPSLNILLKLMAIVSLVFAPVFLKVTPLIDQI